MFIGNKASIFFQGKNFLGKTSFEEKIFVKKANLREKVTSHNPEPLRKVLLFPTNILATSKKVLFRTNDLKNIFQNNFAVICRVWFTGQFINRRLKSFCVKLIRKDSNYFSGIPKIFTNALVVISNIQVKI